VVAKLREELAAELRLEHGDRLDSHHGGQDTTLRDNVGPAREA
jgi:hypothetical protein